MAFFNFFGIYYDTSPLSGTDMEDGCCRVEGAVDSKGRVIIPSKVTFEGKDYIVRQFGRASQAFSREIPSDNRIKDRKKFPIKNIGYYSPFTHNYGDSVSETDALPANTIVTYVKLPDTINRLGSGAFRRCSALEEVILPKAITIISNCCFRDCVSLKNIQLHEGITEIEIRAFDNCRALTEIIIPNSVTSIGDYAFCNCTGLTSITLPNGVTSIGEGAFIWCNLKSVTIPSSVMKIGKWAFTSDELKVVNILNDEGEVMMFPNSFKDGVKINYLGKKADKKTSDSKPAKESVAAKAATIDLEKLIQAALADGTVSDKERSILIKKVKEAGGDVDEFEMLLDARIFEANKMNTKTEPKPAANHTAATKPTATQKGRQTVGALTEAFMKQFGAVLRIYNGRSKADDSISLQDVGLTQEISTSFDGKQKVGDFIAQMANVGLKVKVYTSDEWVAVIDGITLEQAGKVKKNATKADMESMIAKQRDEGAVKLVKSETNVKKSANYGDYTIVVMSDNKVVVVKGDDFCDNTKGALREVSEKVGFDYDKNWTTQQFGSKLVDFLNKK